MIAEEKKESEFNSLNIMPDHGKLEAQI